MPKKTDVTNELLQLRHAVRAALRYLDGPDNGHCRVCKAFIGECRPSCVLWKIRVATGRLKCKHENGTYRGDMLMHCSDCGARALRGSNAP